MNEFDKQQQILNDLPTDTDLLDFTPYVQALADIIEDGGTSTPLTIGIFGDWGSGKTSLMRMIRKELPKSVRSTWFDAWKYDKQQDLWRVLLLQVLTTVEIVIKGDKTDGKPDQKDLQSLLDLKTSLYQDVEREEIGKIEIDGGKLAGSLVQGAVRIGISFLPGVSTLAKLVEELQSNADITEDAFDAIKRERTQIHIEQIKYLEEFQIKLNDLIEKYFRSKNQRLVVFIDDLDRCLPEKAVEVLEAIKLFLDVPGCIFVLGLDKKVVARGIEIKYRELGLPMDRKGKQEFFIEGDRYLEKIIQLPFKIPPIESEDMSDFVCGLIANWPHEECPKVFAKGLGDNPRQVKRTVNVFLLLWRIVEKQTKIKDEIKPILLAKVIAIQHIYPELYEYLTRNAHQLGTLEEYYRNNETGKREMGQRTAVGEAQEVEKASESLGALADFTGRAAVRRILTMHSPEMPDANFSGLKETELRPYFTLTRRTDVTVVEKAEPRRKTFAPEMIRIPKGEFLMGSTDEQVKKLIEEGFGENWAESEKPQHSIKLPEYWISKYPITNAQYAVFVEESSDRVPRYWDDGKFPEELSSHPVVGVSWHDAIAYCDWLSLKDGKRYNLPSEAEWEKAARGDSGLIYPWGDRFDPQKCNTSESNIGTTTPVGQFSPDGYSLYRVADMAGNVWEWTRSLWGEDRIEPTFKYPYSFDDGRENLEAFDSESRVLRGGSFDGGQQVARCACRYRGYPASWSSSVGFRVVLATFSSSDL